MKKLLKKLVFVVAAALMITACGGGSSSPKDVALSFVKAAQSMDFKALKKFVPKAQAEKFDSALKMLDGLMAMPQAKEQMDKAKEAVKDAKFEVVDEKISEDGNSATVKIKTTGLADGDKEEELKLMKEDGSWKVDEDYGSMLGK